MYKQEQIKPYEGTGEKGKLVEEMFDNIAPTYDTLNHRLSWDIDKGWRKKAIRRLAPFSPKKMLDIATGTGDFAILAAQMLHPDQLIGADISDGMMDLMFGDAMICQDPIYFANNGTALERSGSEVNLRQEDGSVLELSPLTAEWNGQEIPSEAVGAFNEMADDRFNWMDVESNGCVQMGVQDNNVFYQGFADYLGVVPEGMVLGISADETEAGQSSVEFVTAVKTDLYYETLSVTMIDGQNPFAEGETQLQMTRSYG
mgnify:CR=1 FL=1